MATDDNMYDFLASVFDGVQAQIPSKLRLKRETNDAQVGARRTKGLSEFERDLLGDIPLARAWWAEYLRSELLSLLTELALNGELPADDWAEQVKNFNSGLPRMRARMVGAQPIIDEVPIFECKDPEVALRAKIAHALLWLRMRGDHDLQVRQCLKKGCEKLFLQRLGPGFPGRPRTCCTDEHTNAYNAAQRRARKKAATKHK
jgi:hypothetical protein